MDIRKSYNRIPHEYFITKGCGESDYEIHAGSYHIALYNAGICNYNIQTYSSVLPKNSVLIDIKETNIPFGSELYTIMSCLHGEKGEYLNCGIIIGDLYDNENKIGSLVCEVVNKNILVDIKTKLDDTIFDLHKNTYSEYKIENIKYLMNEMTVNKKYGTCLVALCFYSYLSFNLSPKL
jgi:arginine decarboxylase